MTTDRRSGHPAPTSLLSTLVYSAVCFSAVLGCAVRIVTL